jgi:hypothetical protein
MGTLQGMGTIWTIEIPQEMDTSSKHGMDRDHRKKNIRFPPLGYYRI